MNKGDLLRKNKDNIIKTGLYTGLYRGFVKENRDPDKRCRVRVYIPGVHPDNYKITDLHWAEVASPYGGYPDFGDVGPLPIEASVYVNFLQGNSDYPVVVGCWYGMPDNKSEIPQVAHDNYPDIKMLKTKSGSSITFIDKSGKERITIQDKNGDKIDIDVPNKRISISSENDINLSTGTDMNTEVSGDINTSAGGDINMQSDQSISIVTIGTVVIKAQRIELGNTPAFFCNDLPFCPILGPHAIGTSIPGNQVVVP